MNYHDDSKVGLFLAYFVIIGVVVLMIWHNL